MTTQLCECDSRDCRETVTTSIEALQYLRAKYDDVVLISSQCAAGPSLAAEPVDEGADYVAYRGRD